MARYSPNSRKAFKIIYKHWTAIQTDIPILRRFLKCTPRLAYRANPNLAKRLVRAKLRRPPTPTPLTGTEQQNITEYHRCDNSPHPNNNTHSITELANLKYPINALQQISSRHHQSGVTPCSNKRCPLHVRLVHSQQARSRISRTYNTHGQATCDTPYIVYLLQCKKCGRQYVGQTLKSLKARFAKHIQAIRDRHRPGVLQEHFRKGRCAGTDNIAIQLLHRVTPETDQTAEQIEQLLKELELLWINRLMSEYPQGLNWAKYDPVKRYGNEPTHK